MTKIYKWKFEGIDISYISSEENIERHILKERARLNTEAKVIYENDTNSNNPIASSPCRTCPTESKEISALSVFVEEDETPTDETSGLLSVSDNLDNLDSAVNPLESNPADSSLVSPGSRKHSK